ncbi:MAG TPA: M23 family metallopeptidase [Tenuifilaceae bacterium]|nr:M23 family metallopeptidase [Tenuifilaceae bacterium]HPI44635.1 M23 family metallopeptidase [Tenuifilaceae bacterium]HPN21990.1 M23 family metallopeptidase [Tenuifilaceae bacterium]
MHLMFRFLKWISFFTVLINFSVLISTSQVKSQTVDVCLDDTLLLSTRDSVSPVNSLPEFANLGKFCSPFRGKVISHFGPRRKRFHAGTDIKLQLGDSVRAAFSGVVTRAKKYYGYGLLVVLKHSDSVETYYSHLSQLLVNVGDTIPAGTVVGLGGRTGRATTTHLHFEFRVNKIAYDSEKLFDFKNQLVLTNEIPVPDKVKVNSITADSIPNYDAGLTPKTENSVQEQVTEIIHIVKRKDTLYSLAKRYGTTVDSICTMNQINKNDILSLGQKLKIR